MRITHGKAHDVTVLDTLPIEPGASALIDQGYLDFGRLYRLKSGLAFFVIRAKSNLDFSRRSSRRVDKTTGLRSDQTIVLCKPEDVETLPRPVASRGLPRRQDKRFVFLSNNFDLPASEGADIYK